MTFANRYWLQCEEDIFLDTATCAMAFRILRVNGYDVPSGLRLFRLKTFSVKHFQHLQTFVSTENESQTENICF
jgi:hypothetical protein